MELIKNIFKDTEDLNLPNTFEIFFNKQQNIPTLDNINYQDKLVYNLLINTDEINFSTTYGNLANIGLETIDYLNSIIYNFSIQIDDERTKFWLVYLCKDHKEINFILWYLQYQYKKSFLKLPIRITDIPNFNFVEIFKYITYIDSDTKLVKNLFSQSNRGLTLL